MYELLLNIKINLNIIYLKQKYNKIRNIIDIFLNLIN
jgi:hypothetical protein